MYNTIPRVPAALFLLSGLLACAPFAWSQGEPDRPVLFQPGMEAFMPRSLFAGGLGLSSIRDEEGITHRYLMLTVQPEFAIGDVGLGFSANVRFSTSDGSVRREDWETFSDVLSVIRYVRYGQKFREGLYARFGAMDGAQLGMGQQLYLYNNDFSLDAPKRGIELDYDFGPYGFESLWSNLAEPEVFGARLFYRPLHASPVPLVNRLTVGLSLTGDLNSRGSYVNESRPGEPFFLEPVTLNDDLSQPPYAVGRQHDQLVLFGADIGLPITALPMLDIIPYLDVANFVGYGAGVATGIQANAQVPLAATIQARLENRLMGDGYIPSYFNAFYEIDRIQRVEEFIIRDEQDNVVARHPVYNTRRNELAAAESRSGWYGSLTALVLNFARVHGSYERLRRTPESGWLHLGTNLGIPGESPVVLRAAYDRWNIGSERDLFRIEDENALITAEVGYQPMRFVLVSLVYQQSFSPIRENGGEILGYERQSRVEPRVQFVMPL